MKHKNKYQPYTSEERQYVIENYHAVGAKQVALHLGRTAAAVGAYADWLRKKGLLAKPKKKVHFQRIRAMEKTAGN